MCAMDVVGYAPVCMYVRARLRALNIIWAVRKNTFPFFSAAQKNFFDPSGLIVNVFWPETGLHPSKERNRAKYCQRLNI